MSQTNLYQQYRHPGEGTVLTGDRDPAPPTFFLGTPLERISAFTYQASLYVSAQPHVRYKYSEEGHCPEQKQIVLISSFLRDAALDWFLDLLNANAELYVAKANAEVDDRNAQARFDSGDGACVLPHHTMDGLMPFQLTGFPFVSEELSSVLAFMRALESRFGGSDTKTPDRSITPTAAMSDVTLDWDLAG